MSFEYEETTQDLQTRIDIHQQFGSRDIDQWMLELLQPQPGARILDVGCGSGKQLLAFHKHLGGQGELTGGDINRDLLDQAQARNAELGEPWRLMELDFDRRFDSDDDSFDLVTCCFAIYYAADPATTVREMHRVLVPGGRLFTTGPMPENKSTFYEVIAEATGAEIPPMPGSSRYNFEIREAIEGTFAGLEVQVFENPLVFEGVEPFLDYTRASLAEDRKLWRPLFTDERGFEQVMDGIRQAAQARLERDGKLVMTKVVGGFVATK